MRLHVVSPCIKDENVTQYCRPVWFTDWKEYAVQDRWHCSLVNLFLIIFFFMSFSSMHMFCKLFHATLISYLNTGGSCWLLPLPGSWDKLWEVLHVVFFFSWSKPWLCMGTELGGLQSRKHAVEPRASISEWFWMNASIFLHRQLWICVSVF